MFRLAFMLFLTVIAVVLQGQHVVSNAALLVETFTD